MIVVGDGVGEYEMVVESATGGRKGVKLARFSMIPPDVLHELAEHYGKGEAKYPSDEDGLANWQRGYRWSFSLDAHDRHLNAWLRGEDFDPETGSCHLIAAMWHLVALRWFQLHGVGVDDLQGRRPARQLDELTQEAQRLGLYHTRKAPPLGVGVDLDDFE